MLICAASVFEKVVNAFSRERLRGDPLELGVVPSA
jgi:hypothetical protein